MQRRTLRQTTGRQTDGHLIDPTPDRPADMRTPFNNAAMHINQAKPDVLDNILSVCIVELCLLTDTRMWARMVMTSLIAMAKNSKSINSDVKQTYIQHNCMVDPRLNKVIRLWRLALKIIFCAMIYKRKYWTLNATAESYSGFKSNL